jgi:hypothetical protein
VTRRASIRAVVALVTCVAPWLAWTSHAQEPAAPDAPAPTPVAPAPEPPSVAVEPARDEETFGATARVHAPEAGSTRLALEETRELPGAFGDPFRIIDALPGVTPIASGLSYDYVRGAPPGTIGYYYDEIALPQLYHLALGPGVIHPRLLGSIDFSPGVAPARYGRRLGATLAAAGPDPTHRLGGEVELRLLDVNGYLEAPLGEGGVRVAGRYGYPGPLLSALDNDMSLSYWDYQGRIDLVVAPKTHAEFVLLGSFDSLDEPFWAGPSDRFTAIDLEFHRLEARLFRRTDAVEVGGAVRVGYDTSSIDRELAVEAASFGPRTWAAWKLGDDARLRVGADMLGSVGDIESISGSAPTVFAGRRQIRVDLPFVADAPARNAGGTFAELALKPASWNALELGARWDAWIVGGTTETAVDPRLRVIFYPADAWDLHVAGGLTHQPAVFLFPIPGLTEVALDRGLQEAIQSDAGVGVELPGRLRFEMQGFVHHYQNLLLPELYAPEEGATVPTVDAWSYGAEVFLRRPAEERLSGWVSYTLAWATAHQPPDGRSFAPEFDVRHVLNVVVQARWEAGWQVGGRLHAHSNRPFNQFDLGRQDPTYAIRLPWFMRADARVGYAWLTSWGAMLVYAEWLNLTLAQEALGAECLYGTCTKQTAPAVFIPNLGARAQF